MGTRLVCSNGIVIPMKRGTRKPRTKGIECTYVPELARRLVCSNGIVMLTS